MVLLAGCAVDDGAGGVPPDPTEAAGLSSAPVAGCDEASVRASVPASRRAIFDRGLHWVDQRVPYSQSSYHEGYRQDCSGFVSMCWGLDRSYVTGNFAPYSNAVSHTIDWSDLTPGDALNINGSSHQHIVIFAGWLDAGHNNLCVMEESQTGEPAELKTWSAGYAHGYYPVRYNTDPPGVTDDNAPPPPQPPPERVIRFYDADYTGDGRTDALFYDREDGNWWLGASDGSSLGWHSAGNTRGFGDIIDANHWSAVGDFNGDGRADVLMYSRGDGNWWLGLSDGNALGWSLAGNTQGFGDLLDGHHALYVSDVDGDGKTDVVMYFDGDGHVFFGRSSGTSLGWSLASDTHGFGDLLDGQHWITLGDFTGDGRADVLMYSNGDDNWWLGASDGGTLGWHLASNTRGFGHLLDNNHWLVTGDTNGDHRTDVVMYSRGDGNWFDGVTDGGGDLAWHLASNTRGFGDLMDGNHWMAPADVDGDGRTDVLMYSRGDGNWWLGAAASDGSTGWSALPNTSGFGDLMTPEHALFLGDYDGDHRADVLMYSGGDGNWWMSAQGWHRASNTTGFGDLTR